MARVSTFLIMVALLAGMVGCSGGAGESYTLTIASTAGGSVLEPGEGTFTYCEPGTVVNLVAEPDAGYGFGGWTGDVWDIADASLPATCITMNGDYVITANFCKPEIWDWYDLDAIRNNLGCNYLLMNDLNSATAGYVELASPTTNGGKGWHPIGGTAIIDPYTGEVDLPNPFVGTFDGQGYEIRDLFINRPDQHGIGLLGWVGEGGVIKNLGVTNAHVIGGNATGSFAGSNGGNVTNSYFTGSVAGWMWVGGLVGSIGNGLVSNCHSTGDVTGEENVGGLVGDNYGAVEGSWSSGTVTGELCAGGLAGRNFGTIGCSDSSSTVTGEDRTGGLAGINSGIISNSHSHGTVVGNLMVAGLVGWDSSGTVNDSYSTARVSGNESVGGLVGCTQQSTVTNCHSTGNVTGWRWVGGLIGSNHGTTTNCYSTSSVSGYSSVGGLVGYNYVGTLTKSYSVGDVTGDAFVGGLVGHSQDTVSNCFWDTETSGQSASAGGTGKTTTEMQDITTFSGATWDIVAVANPDSRNPLCIWNIVDDETYPFLSWEPAS